MPLPLDVERKIMALGRGEAVNRGFLDLYRVMANEAVLDGSPAKTMILPMYDKDSGLKPGDWAAELHFVIRKVESVEPEASTTESGLQDVRGLDSDGQASIPSVL